MNEMTYDSDIGVQRFEISFKFMLITWVGVSLQGQNTIMHHPQCHLGESESVKLSIVWQFIDYMDSQATFTNYFRDGTTCMWIHKLHANHPACVSMCIGRFEVDVVCLCDTIVYNIYFLFMSSLCFKYLWDVFQSLIICLVCVWTACHSCRWGSTRSWWWCWRKGLGLCLLSFIVSLCWDCKVPMGYNIGDWFIILCLCFKKKTRLVIFIS